MSSDSGYLVVYKMPERVMRIRYGLDGTEMYGDITHRTRENALAYGQSVVRHSDEIESCRVVEAPQSGWGPGTVPATGDDVPTFAEPFSH